MQGRAGVGRNFPAEWVRFSSSLRRLSQHKERQMRLFNGGAILAAAVAGGIGSLATTHAALVFQEGFDYTRTGPSSGKYQYERTPNDAWSVAGTRCSSQYHCVFREAARLRTRPRPRSQTRRTASTERLNFPTISSGTVWYSMTFNANIGHATVNTPRRAYFAGISSLRRR